MMYFAGDFMERAAGIEPASLAWKAKVLPLHNARSVWSASISLVFGRQVMNLTILLQIAEIGASAQPGLTYASGAGPLSPHSSPCGDALLPHVVPGVPAIWLSKPVAFLLSAASPAGWYMPVPRPP